MRDRSIRSGPINHVAHPKNKQRVRELIFLLAELRASPSLQKFSSGGCGSHEPSALAVLSVKLSVVRWATSNVCRINSMVLVDCERAGGPT